MEAPLLALTRRRAGAGDDAWAGTAAETMRQLAQLRWIAVAGQTATILVVHFGFGVALPLGWMLGAALLLALANLGAALSLPRHRVRRQEVTLALLFDMGVLTFQLYCSGGAANPFIALYLLQVVLGAIVLPIASVTLLAGATALCYGLLTFRAMPLVLPGTLGEESADLFAIGRWISFVLVAGLLVLFINRISRNLRARDAYLADLRQRATEEEGIVRMGLFASGAAHELGSPLGSLAVTLADWRRMPAIARNPELAAEVAEMQAELQRCKSILSDILHSAGQPRGEAMQSIGAGAFLGSVAAAWRDRQPQVKLDCALEAMDKVPIAVDPALRQAIWNLLDNAAEVSPGGVRLSLQAKDGMLAIRVRDAGPGFDAETLANIGKLYQSTKGAGHGLGLFLAANVARRLGGRLEARNLEQGAEVGLLLPMIRESGA